MASSKATTVEQYLAELPADRRADIEKVRDAVNAALPAGYREGIGYGMIGCQAQALDVRLTIDFTELDDARWFSREEVAAALAGDAGSAFLAPPRFAIARTLLEDWLTA